MSLSLQESKRRYDVYSSQPEIIYDNSSFELRLIQAKKRNSLDSTDRSLFVMTPQEQLFAKFYNEEKVSISDLSDDALRARRDEMRQIAFEARVKYTADEDELNDRVNKRSKKSAVATENNLEITANAINNVKTRAARMSKLDKVRENLRDAGLNEEEIEAMMSAGKPAKIAEMRDDALRAEKGLAKPIIEQNLELVQNQAPVEVKKSSFSVSFSK